MSIRVRELIECFERMYREHWAYEYGAAREGCVDCSGALVYAYNRYGVKLEHGSNSIARLRCGTLQPMTQAMPGMAAFKCRVWTADQKSNRHYGTAPGDLYHIGLVGYDGKILNAQSSKTGFVKSDPVSWDFCAFLRDVDYGEEECGLMESNARVVTQGGRLNVREAASTNAAVAGKLENGARVQVTGDAENGWYAVQAGSVCGYASAQYIALDENTEANGIERIERLLLLIAEKLGIEVDG